jgi:hypothetical protein
MTKYFGKCIEYKLSLQPPMIPEILVNKTHQWFTLISDSLLRIYTIIAYLQNV